MILLIKHRWYWALLATVLGAGAAWWLGGWRDVIAGPLPLAGQIAAGIAGAFVALAINGMVHESFKRACGAKYIAAFDRYSHEILDGMRWPEYLAGGVMAGLAEEPLFRGVLLRQFLQPGVNMPIVGVIVAAVAFGLCHWVRWRYVGFWIWAVWEGILFGVLLVLTGSLLVPMIAHALHDVAAYRVMRSLRPDSVKSSR
ncbi:MAG: CPBP family intramembrane metalloprotease [Planctomycetia bacterium]|nr:CPBP family intramembrane metalloprotease [Planctomycetia bacterium]